MRQTQFRRRDLAGQPAARRHRRARLLPAHRGTAGRPRRDLRRDSRRSQHRGGRTAHEHGRGRRGLPRIRFRRTRPRWACAAAPTGHRGRRHARDRPELLRVHQLSRRRRAVARPAWRRARRARCRHRHPERQSGAEPDHAAALAAAGLSDDVGQPGDDRHSGMYRGPGGRPPRHRHRPAYRGPCRSGRIRTRGWSGARPRPADGRAEDRPVRDRRRHRAEPYRVAGRTRRAV